MSLLNQCLILISLIFSIIHASTPDFSLFGFGAVDGDKGQVLVGGTTGGAEGNTVVVTTAEEFINNIARPEPQIIHVKGTINLPVSEKDEENMHFVNSNKTIIGIGADATISGGGLNIGIPRNDTSVTPPPNTVHNVIVRNLNFTSSGDDAINVQMFSHHIWIDHNNMTGAKDGLIDIKRGSSYITVSWNYCHDHNKTWLLGHDNDFAHQDTGRLRITYHHNYCNNTKTRIPRVRFGEPVHVLNNYISNGNYSGASTCDAGIYMEGNYIYNIDNPLRFDFDGEPLGRAFEINNVCDSCGNPFKTAGIVEKPSKYYSYKVDDPNTIPNIIKTWAGTGKIDFTKIEKPYRNVNQESKLISHIESEKSFTITGVKIPENVKVGFLTGVYIVKHNGMIRKVLSATK